MRREGWLLAGFVFRPDRPITVVADWALKTNFLPSHSVCFVFPFFAPFSHYWGFHSKTIALVGRQTGKAGRELAAVVNCSSLVLFALGDLSLQSHRTADNTGRGRAPCQLTFRFACLVCVCV